MIDYVQQVKMFEWLVAHPQVFKSFRSAKSPLDIVVQFCDCVNKGSEVRLLRYANLQFAAMIMFQADHEMKHLHIEHIVCDAGQMKTFVKAWQGEYPDYTVGGNRPKGPKTFAVKDFSVLK
jgi:hypothetical protein